MNFLQEINKAWSQADRNTIAALLSIVPGLGHLYKHHYVAGFGILIGGNIIMALFTGLVSIATFGIGLIVVPLVYWLCVAAGAYQAKDWHGKHQYLHPWR